jgi:Ca2+-binding RTX toxin-like protein
MFVGAPAMKVDLGEGTATGWGADDLAGFENVTGSGKADTIDGDDGVNRLDGRTGSDTINGHDGVDLLVGGDSKDRLFGQKGDDRLLGGNDSDQLDGGQGNDDVCHGGSGADAFANCENYRTSPNELSLLIG